MAHKRRIIYLASFLFSIPVAITTYINSSFLETFVGTEKVGLVYIFSSIATILGLFVVPKLLSRLGNRLMSLYLSIFVLISFLVLALTSNSTVAVFAFIANFAGINFLVMSLDIFIEDFSKGGAIGKFRGFYLMIINVAWVLAQMLSGSIITKSSYEGIYLFAGFFMLLVSSIFMLFLHDFKDPIYKNITMWKTFKFFLSRKNILNIYIINFILKFFFAWMVIYTPIYLHEYVGLGWDKLGIIFTIMLLPFVFMEYPLGKFSDKSGEKKMLSFGFLISALATLAIPFITTPTVWLFALVLFLTRVGAATIEIMSETYFFKSVDEENVDALGFFRNTTPLSYILAPLLATPLIFYSPSFEYLFYALGAILLLGFLLTLRLKDVR